MKYEPTQLTEYKSVTVGQLKIEQQGKRERFVRCKGIHIGKDGKYYAHWQYVLKSTLRPSGKQATSFLSAIM